MSAIPPPSSLRKRYDSHGTHLPKTRSCMFCFFSSSSVYSAAAAQYFFLWWEKQLSTKTCQHLDYQNNSNVFKIFVADMITLPATHLFHFAISNCMEVTDRPLLVFLVTPFLDLKDENKKCSDLDGSQHAKYSFFPFSSVSGKKGKFLGNRWKVKPACPFEQIVPRRKRKGRRDWNFRRRKNEK